MRSDVLVKLELLDNKHVQDIVHQVGEYFTRSIIYVMYYYFGPLVAAVDEQLD